MTKTVCFITQSYYDVDPRVRRKAEALVAADYEVDVLALRDEGGEASYSINGVNVRTCSIGKLRGSQLRYAFEYVTFFLWACVRVTVQMFRRQYAVVDVNTLPDFLIFAGVFARWKGAKLVLDMHEITPEFYMSKYGIGPTSWKIRFVKYLERISFAFADHVITINDPIQQLLVGRGLQESKATVITNSADDARFADATRSVDDAVGGESSRFVMVYHGTLTRIYGLDIAIDAFAKVHDRMPSAELWILGDGPEQSNLSTLTQKYGLEDKIRIVGRVPADEIPMWLAKCDVGLLPIRRDVFLDYAFPNKLPEFVISGKTVIVSGLKAIQYYFSEDAVAYFEPNNVDDLAQQMLRLYCDPELRERLVYRARLEYRPISWNRMKDRYLALIEQMTCGCDSEQQEELVR
jgi:glycosyltransferase involved in cell wall biosynthesis